MKKPRILRRRTLCRTPYFKISRLEAQFEGFRKTYYLSEHGERVGILVVKGGEVLLVRQYRLLAGRSCWEIPGGGIEGKETPRTAAEREVREEGGVRCRKLRPFFTFMPGTDTLFNRTHLFIGQRIEPVAWSATREIEGRRWVDFDQCLRWIRRGILLDGMTVTALLAYRALRLG
jgi:8-oxo-dGTP pyrophosphatase MutT (NUDIX family)